MDDWDSPIDVSPAISVPSDGWGAPSAPLAVPPVAAPPEQPLAPTFAPATALPAAAPAAPRGARTSAGFTVLVVAAGTGLGAVLGGPQGAGAGLLLAGAGSNLFRARKSLSGDVDTGEGAKSLTLGLLGIAAGGYLLYRCFSRKKKD